MFFQVIYFLPSMMQILLAMLKITSFTAQAKALMTSYCHWKIFRRNVTKLSQNQVILSSDNKLSFDEHVKRIYKKVNSKLSAKGTPNVDIRQRKMLLNVFFNYCPLTQVLWSCCSNLKIKYLPERNLRLIYSDKRS